VITLVPLNSIYPHPVDGLLTEVINITYGSITTARKEAISIGW